MPSCLNSSRTGLGVGEAFLVSLEVAAAVLVRWRLETPEVQKRVQKQMGSPRADLDHVRVKHIDTATKEKDHTVTQWGVRPAPVAPRALRKSERVHSDH